MRTTSARGIAVVAILCAASSPVWSVTPSPPLTPQQLGFTSGSREDLLARCKKVALLPLDRPALPGLDPEASARLEAATRSALGDLGMTFISTDSYTRAVERFSRAVGGVYDPYLGTQRRNAYQSVLANALRDFVSQEAPDCLATLEVALRTANWRGNHAYWDFVEESVYGEVQSAAAAFFFGSRNESGTIGALSLRLQISNPEGKLLYSRFGGVQLTTYLNKHAGKGESDFLGVARTKWLQDDKRLGRALTAATVPLRYTPEQISAGWGKDQVIDVTLVPLTSLPVPPAGGQFERPAALQMPREELLKSLHRVALGPLLLNGFTPPTEYASHVTARVRERLAPLNWDIVDAPSLNSAFEAALKSTGGLYDPNTGVLDKEKQRAVFASVTKSLGLTPPPDAILVMALAHTRAEQRSGNARWDGTAQQALTFGNVVDGPHMLGGSADNTAGEGFVDASSFEVILRDSEGKVTYRARGGIELLQQLSIKTEIHYPRTEYKQQLATRAPSELFKDESRNAAAIDAALRELVLSPAEIAAQDAAAREKPSKH
jgi:hypothetical protein